MSHLSWKRVDRETPNYVAKAPEGIYRITPTGNGRWQIKTPFGSKAEESLSEAKRAAARIRFNTLRNHR